MSNPSKARGTKFETDMRTYLREARRYDVERLATTGAKDEGDLVLKLRGIPYVLELKATRTLDLAGGVREAEAERVNYAMARELFTPARFALIHKRRGAPISHSYVTAPLFEWLEQIDPNPIRVLP